jgi:hypothetical protein
MATINPFQGPIDYSIDVQNPFEAAIGGFKIGASGAEAQAQRQAQEKAKTYQKGIDTFFSKPAAQRTYSDIEPLLVGANKQQFDALQAVSKNMSDEKLNSSKRFTGQLLVALEQNPESAKTHLNDRIEAETDPQQKLAWQDALKGIDIAPQKVADQIELLGAATFGKDWYAGITDVRRSRETAAEAPVKLREQLAKASKAETDALVAVQTATDDVAKAKAQRQYEEAKAESERVKAKYAEKTTLADFEKKAADLGLTKAQTGSALAQGRKLGAEASAAILELEALKKGGTLATPKAFEQEEKLRKEFQLRTKVYGELGGTFNNIKSSADAKTGPGDIALITGFMKMLDPGSVVRETEFATARDTAGLYTRLENSLKKAETGQFLQPNQRSEFVNLAKQYLDSAQKKAGEEKTALGVVVKNYRLNPENVFGPEATAPAPTGGRGVINAPLPTGTPTNRNVTVDY